MADTTFRAHGAVGNGIVDDTLALQRALDENPSYSKINGEGLEYKITGPLVIPALSKFLTIESCRLTAPGDTEMLKANAGALYFRLQRAWFVCKGHTTAGRRAIDMSNMSLSTFEDVWLDGTVNKTDGIYCYGTGDSPYYNEITRFYCGNFRIGIFLNDADAAHASNSNTIRDCRINPGPGTGGVRNIGVYVGNGGQNTRIENNVFEWSDGSLTPPPGGIGVYNAAVATAILGNRFENMQTGVAYTDDAQSGLEAGNYYECVDERTFGLAGWGERTTVIHEVTAASGQSSRFAGDVKADGFHVGATQVVGPRRTGWTAATGTANRAAYATYAAPAIGPTYNQAQILAVAAALQAASQRIKGLEDDLTAHGLIGT